MADLESPPSVSLETSFVPSIDMENQSGLLNTLSISTEPTDKLDTMSGSLFSRAENDTDVVNKELKHAEMAHTDIVAEKDVSESINIHQKVSVDEDELAGDGILDLRPGNAEAETQAPIENEDEKSAHPSPILPPKPLTAYFLFLAEHRARIAKQNPGKISTATKVLGNMWKELSAEHKEVYIIKSKEMKETYEQAIAEYNTSRGITAELSANEKATTKGKGTTKKTAAVGSGFGNEIPLTYTDPVVLPLARIKKIMSLDEETHHISKDALTFMTKATELFVQWFSRRANRLTMSQKRKTVKAGDINLLMKELSALEFLKGCLEPISEANDSGMAKSKKPKVQKGDTAQKEKQAKIKTTDVQDANMDPAKSFDDKNVPGESVESVIDVDQMDTDEAEKVAYDSQPKLTTFFSKNS